MMILRDIDLHRSTNRSSSNLKVRDLDKSLFIESLDMLTESDKEINDLLKRIHIDVTLSESKDITYLNEFNVRDFIDNVIKAFIQIITKIFDSFKSLFNKLFKKDAALKQYESKIKSFEGEFNLSFERYNYTIYNDIPQINLNREFSNIYDDLMRRLKSLKNIKFSGERIAKMESIESDINNSLADGYYDSIRGRSLKYTSGISDGYYSDALFNIFRDGGNKITSKVNSTDLTTIYDRYMKSDDFLKDTEKLKNDTIKSAKEVEKKVNSITLGSINKNYDDSHWTEKEEVPFNKILSTVTGNIKATCDIFTLAFSAKCDAIKESVKQDRKALNEAIKYIQTNKNL